MGNQLMINTRGRCLGFLNETVGGGGGGGGREKHS